MSVGVAAPARAWLESDGKLLRLRLTRPKANLIDGEMIAALDAALDEYLQRHGLLAALVDAEGPHFSFGASVAEHLPAHCAAMLGALHGLLLRLVESPVPVLFAVRGQCLGGGLELVCSGSFVFASPDAAFAQPEIKLGVFAPAASCFLPEAIGRAAAEELLLSGRSITSQEALRLGLVHAVADDPAAAALAWFETNLADKSAAAIRRALHAVRSGYGWRMREKLACVEEAYLDDLMSTHDAIEGLEAFLAKRPARWEHR